MILNKVFALELAPDEVGTGTTRIFHYHRH